MGCRVFICDDEAGYRLLLRAVLEPEGADIVGEASDGGACVEQVMDARPDLVLLDLRMPRVDGLTALPELRRRVPDAKVLVLTTAPAAEAKEQTMRLGAAGFVQKPRDITRLPEALRLALA